MIMKPVRISAKATVINSPQKTTAAAGTHITMTD